MKSFADDTRATKLIKTLEDVIQLQKDLERIYKWTSDNNMKLNDVKFELLRYGKNELIKDETHYTSPSGEIIQSKSVVKDLGVLMSNDCTFKEQILSIIVGGDVILQKWHKFLAHLSKVALGYKKKKQSC